VKWYQVKDNYKAILMNNDADFYTNKVEFKIKCDTQVLKCKVSYILN